MIHIIKHFPKKFRKKNLCNILLLITWKGTPILYDAIILGGKEFELLIYINGTL